MRYCPLCDQLGREDRAHNHDFDACYLNPLSRFFKPGVWKWRCRMLAAAGELVPLEMNWQEGIDFLLGKGVAV